MEKTTLLKAKKGVQLNRAQCTAKVVEEHLMKGEEGRKIVLIQSSQHLNDVSNRMSTPT